MMRRSFISRLVLAPFAPAALLTSCNVRSSTRDEGSVLDELNPVRTAAARSKAQNNLKQIGMALHNYASASFDGAQIPIHGVGPGGNPLRKPTDKPLLSWRVAILPYIEQSALYIQFKLDEPWDSENNKKLIDAMPKVFASITKPGQPGYTHLQQIIGPAAMQPGKWTIATIPDGTANVIAVIEATEPVIWTKPDDVMIPDKAMPADLKSKFGGQFRNGVNILMWDGSVRFIDLRNVSDKTLWNAIRPDDGEPLADW